VVRESTADDAEERVQDTYCVRVVSGWNRRKQITREVRPKCKAGRPVPKRKLSSEQLAAVKELAKQWGKIVAKSAYGQDGPPLDADFDQMEQIAAAASTGLVEGTLEHLAQQQARRLPEQLPCPTCQKSRPVETRPRKVVARGATIALSEPVARCPDCRRDFFPPADQPQT
jgi:hypothetical protein